MSGLKRMKALNSGQTPRSSLGPALQVHAQDAHHDPRDGRAAKRQKHDRATPKTSHFFVGELTSNKGDYEDLTFDGSPTEAVDLVSVSSAGKSQAATAGLAEYRKTQISAKANGRRRRRRSEGPGLQVKKESHAVEPDPTKSKRTFLDLIYDIGRDDSASPPPANIVSDISQKRGRPVHHQDDAQLPIKRPRNGYRRQAESISDDEDELAGSGPSPRRGAVRTTNFSHVTGRSQNRGDIQRTTFEPAPEVESKRHIPTKSSKAKEICVVGAACRKSIYPLNDQQAEGITLSLEPEVARVVSTNGQGRMHLPWLEIDASKVLRVVHNVTNSRYVMIMRSSSTACPPYLSLELKAHTDAMNLITWLSPRQQSGCAFDEKDETYLETTFKRNFGQSKAARGSGDSPQQSTKVAQSNSLSKPIPDRNSLARLRDPNYLRDPFKGEPTLPRPEKLKDRMQGSNAVDASGPAQEFAAESFTPSTRAQRMETRRTRKSSPDHFMREPSPDRWTVLNPNWGDNWQGSLVFPPTGRNRATVDKDDISRLDEGEFLNDNLINFYFRYLQQKLEAEKPDMLEKVYFFSTFFYEKLRANRGKVNYDGVKAWTAKVDLLSYKYIIVPVNENAHWYLAIIYNAPRTLPDGQKKDNPLDEDDEEVEMGKAAKRGTPSVATVQRDISFISLEDEPTKPAISVDVAESPPAMIAVPDSQEPSAKGQSRRPGGPQKLDPDLPRIITLDSLGSSHSPTCRFLKDYLAREAEDKKGVELSLIPVGLTAKNIPEQNNYCDCGVFILGYIEEFLKNPDEAIRKLIQKEDLEWDVRPSKIRNQVRDLLFMLKKEQQQRLDKEKEEKRKRKAQKVSTLAAAPVAQSQKETADETSKTSKGEQPKPPEAKPAINGIQSTATTNTAEQKQLPPKPLSKGKSTSPGKVDAPIAKSNKVPDLVKPLVEESDEENPPSSSNIYLSAHTSPFKKPDVKRAVDLTASEDKPNRAIAPSPGKRRSGEFVRALSATTDATADEIIESLESKGVNDRRSRTASPEKVKTRHKVSQYPATYMKGRSSSQLLPSIETDHSPSGPQYDGVDRSIDLTLESQ